MPDLRAKAGNELSPIFESPLGLFDPELHGRMLEDQYGIPARRLTGQHVARGREAAGRVRRRHLQVLGREAPPLEAAPDLLAKTEPGDENNQDISSLVGKVDIRKLEHFGQNDPDAYSYSGGLNRTTQGVLEFVEMFKAPIKMLHPLLTATQDRTYVGTENVGAMPYQGLIIAHSNESEWQSFRANKNNEAFLDRISVIKVPYCLRVTEEKQIYQKLLASSELKDAPFAPGTLEMLARFSVLTRLKPHENSSLYSKMRVYDGESLKDTDPHAKTIQEYRDAAGVPRAWTAPRPGLPTRCCRRPSTSTRRRSRPTRCTCIYVIEQAIRREQMPEETEERWLEFLKEELSPRYAEFIGNEIQKAYLESYHDFGQNLFDRYVAYADAWIEDHDFKDPDTGQLMSRQVLEQELSKIEKPAGIANPKDFRFEVVKFSLRARVQERRQEPELDELREDPRRHRAAHVQPGGGPAARHQFRQEAGQRDREEARGVRASHGGARLHGPPGAPPRGMVHAGEEVELIDGCCGRRPLMLLTRGGGRASAAVSRVQDAGSQKGVAGRQCRSSTDASIRKPRASAIASDSCAAPRRRSAEAIKDSLQSRKVAEAEGAEKVTIRSKSLREPSFRSGRNSGQHDYVLPGNEEYKVGDEIPKPQGGGGGRGSQGSPDGEGQDDFTFTLTKDEFLDLFFDDLKLPQPHQGQAQGPEGAQDWRVPASPPMGRPPGSTARAPCARASAGAWRCGGRARPRSSSCEEELAAAEAENPARCEEDRRAADALRAQAAAAPHHRLHRSDRSWPTTASIGCPSPPPRLSCSA